MSNLRLKDKWEGGGNFFSAWGGNLDTCISGY